MKYYGKARNPLVTDIWFNTVTGQFIDSVFVPESSVRLKMLTSCNCVLLLLSLHGNKKTVVYCSPLYRLHQANILLDVQSRATTLKSSSKALAKGSSFNYWYLIILFLKRVDSYVLALELRRKNEISDRLSLGHCKWSFLPKRNHS